MKTNNFSNGSELAYFQDRNCFECKHYNFEDAEKSCGVEVKLSLGAELDDGEFREYFNSVAVDSGSKCLKIGKIIKIGTPLYKYSTHYGNAEKEIFKVVGETKTQWKLESAFKQEYKCRKKDLKVVGFDWKLQENIDVDMDKRIDEQNIVLSARVKIDKLYTDFCQGKVTHEKAKLILDLLSKIEYK